MLVNIYGAGINVRVRGGNSAIAHVREGPRKGKSVGHGAFVI